MVTEKELFTEFIPMMLKKDLLRYSRLRRITMTLSGDCMQEMYFTL